MAREKFVEIRFTTERRKMIGTMNAIITEYQQQGYVLTVRQLYYQCVARGLIENSLRSYKNLASLINDARMAGLLDWKAIEDRTRDFIKRSSWRNGKSILESAAHSFHLDMWATQERRVYVVIEKEALTGVLEGVCHEYDIPLLAARGYPSASVLYDFAQSDLGGEGQDALILHLGDHDPSGIDMSRDLEERISLFTYGGDFELRRIALNMNQVEEQNPPPNPAKTTDARFDGYLQKYGDESWELDALSPEYIVTLVREQLDNEIDFALWDARKAEIEDVRAKLWTVAEEFTD